MKNIFRTTTSLLGVTLMASQLFGSTTAASLSVPGSSSAFEQAMPTTSAQKEVTSLLERISSNAAVAGRHAATLESFTRGNPSLQRETHAAELSRTKGAINAMGSDFGRLQELRATALPWQQMLIDRIQPVLVGLAGHATEAIERMNEDRGPIPSEEYRDAVANLYAYAGQVRNMVSVNLDYAEAREKLNRLDAPPMETVASVSQAQEASGSSSASSKSLVDRVRSELVRLPYYGVFDYLTFQVEGDQVTLNGHVSRPTLKTDAERVVRRIEGVATVSSKIEVLPLSSHDDRIRMAAYRAIYGHSTLMRYRLNPNPPIRIIVKNGNLTLMGVVGSDMDRSIAHMQANSVPGAFSVTNNLQLGS
jgi:hyperosmotically inducible protein